MFLRIVVTTWLLVNCCHITLAEEMDSSSEESFFHECTYMDCVLNSSCATIFEKADHKGRRQCISIPEGTSCVNLENRWWGILSSIKLLPPSGWSFIIPCLRVYEYSNCQGDWLDISLGDHFQDNLDKVHWDNRVHSISRCTKETNDIDYKYNTISKYDRCTTEECSGQAACVTIFQDADYEGSKQCTTIPGPSTCVTLDNWWDDGRVSSLIFFRAKNMKGNNSRCIRVYNEKYCEGDLLQITPSAHFQDKLDIVQWDNRIKSISTCEREVFTDPRCKLKYLFTPYSENDTKIVQSAEGLLKIIMRVMVNALSLKVPLVNTIWSAFKQLTGIFESDTLNNAMVLSVIDKELAKRSTSQLSAKMKMIIKHMEMILSPRIPTEDKKTDITIALSACAEIMHLFEDETYSFSKNKLMFSPHLVAFSGIYMTVAQLSLKMHPYRMNWVLKDMLQLKEIIKNYKLSAISKRQSHLHIQSTRMFKREYITDSLTCNASRNVFTFDFTSLVPGGCWTVDLYTDWEPLLPHIQKRCLENMKKLVKPTMDAYFETILNQLDSTIFTCVAIEVLRSWFEAFLDDL